MQAKRHAGWLLGTAIGLFAALPGLAADIALVLGNRDYKSGANVSSGDAVLSAVSRLERAGVDVISARDADHDRLFRAAGQFEQMTGNADGLLVVLSGRFVSSDYETWFLPTDTQAETLSTLPREALPLSSLMAMLAELPRRAILVLAHDGERDRLGRYLSEGPGEIEAPQGVTVITGSPDKVTSLLRDTMAVPGASITARVRSDNGLRAYGFLPEDHAFLTFDSRAEALRRERAEAVARELRRQEEMRLQQSDLRERERQAAEQLRREQEAAGDERLWATSASRDTEEAYRAYLDRYPNGKHAEAARNRLADIRNDPDRIAKLAEERLSLTRDQRREIQRNLSLLDYNTRGIDGIFGPGTRAAITAWQKAEGLRNNGYLDAAQIDRLSRQAGQRAAQLEEQAKARRAELERADTAYWREMGEGNNERGIRLYLERYPDGRYADVAKENLEILEQRKRAQTSAQEAQAWSDAVMRNTEQSYQAYLSLYPQGSYTNEAAARITQLRARPDPALEQARAEEAAMNMAPLARRLVEQRLATLGHEPGEIDGNFDEQTRRALRRYQDEASLPVTGFMNQDTVVRLLADTVRGILR